VMGLSICFITVLVGVYVLAGEYILVGVYVLNVVGKLFLMSLLDCLLELALFVSFSLQPQTVSVGFILLTCLPQFYDLFCSLSVLISRQAWPMGINNVISLSLMLLLQLLCNLTWMVLCFPLFLFFFPS